MAFDQATADLICERLAEGESLRTICRSDGMPSRTEVFRWLADDANAAFRDQYARAKEFGIEAMADDIQEISDDARNDWMEANGEDNAGWRANGEHIQRSRLRVDSRKWILSKLAPKKYGDKIEQTIGGPNGGPVPVEATIRFIKPEPREG